MTVAPGICLEAVVPGTTEAAWHAVATGEGNGAWFIPASIQEELDGTTHHHLGTEVDDRGVVTAWDPPRRFAYLQDPPDPSSGLAAVRLATEFVIADGAEEAACVVRLVVGGFPAGSEWDRLRCAVDEGWRLYLASLQLHLAQSECQHRSSILAAGHSSDGPAQAFDALRDRLGLGSAQQDDRVMLRANDQSELAGTVAQIDTEAGALRIETEAPAPGFAVVSVDQGGDGLYPTVRAFFCDEALDVDAYQRDWQAWMDQEFPGGMAHFDAT